MLLCVFYGFIYYYIIWAYLLNAGITLFVNIWNIYSLRTKYLQELKWNKSWLQL